MTFCLAMKVDSGLVALADTRIVKGAEHASKAKISHMRLDQGELFLMTSGLRSVRDKVAIYFEEDLNCPEGKELTHLYQAGNLFGRELRRVRNEDGESLERGKLAFNLHAILGGRLCEDAAPELLYIYPEGNWVQATADAPYHVIGRTTYGRPILDRLLTDASSLSQAVALAYLAFDATRASVTDVDFPIDIAVLDAATGILIERRFQERELAQASQWWRNTLEAALTEFPTHWAEELFKDATS